MMDWCLFFQPLSQIAPVIQEAEESKNDGMRAVVAPDFLLGRSQGQSSGWRLPRGPVLTCLCRTRRHIYLRRPAVLGGWEARSSQATL